MKVPQGWEPYSEIHELVPPASPGAPQYVNHTKRWAAAGEPRGRAFISLTAFEGPNEPQTLELVRRGEASPRIWDTSRSEEVVLGRNEAASGGLTIASWDQSPTLHVSVIASGPVTLEQVKAAVESAAVQGT